MVKRLFVILAAALVLFPGCRPSGKVPEREKKEISVQLYSLRSIIGDQYGKVLKDLADMGFTSVEAAGYADGKFYGRTPEEFKSDLEAVGMKALSSHVNHPLDEEDFASGDFSDKLAWWDACIADHKAAGMKYLVTPWMGSQANLKNLQLYCDYFNAIGRKCSEAGIKYGYHNHAYEFEKVEDQVMYDYMLQHTDPACVFFQMDVYWAVIGNASPVDYFERYPGRFRLLHIKDEKEIGQSGMVGFDAIFRNAAKAGLEGFIVEVERYSYDDVERSVKESIDYLLDAPFVKASYPD